MTASMVKVRLAVALFTITSPASVSRMVRPPIPPPTPV